MSFRETWRTRKALQGCVLSPRWGDGQHHARYPWQPTVLCTQHIPTWLAQRAGEMRRRASTSKGPDDGSRTIINGCWYY